MEHILPVLPYGYDALEPYIDAPIMEIHHPKHRQVHIINLHTAHKGQGVLSEQSFNTLLRNLNEVPESIRTTVVRNHSGGHANHSLLWPTLKKDANKGRNNLSAAWSWGVRFLDLPEKNPFAKVEKFSSGQHEKHVAKSDDCWKVFHVINGDQDKLMLYCSLSPGARRDEIFRLT